jgi:hypothetical protein
MVPKGWRVNPVSTSAGVGAGVPWAATFVGVA